MRSNYDVYRGSLDTSSTTENIISIISNTLLVNQRVENEPTKKPMIGKLTILKSLFIRSSNVFQNWNDVKKQMEKM
jgi:hypothetical protein